MELSIIIVNYNVRHFLEHCLRSVEKALTDIDSEIIVIDNNSVDGSCQMIREKFPNVQLIANKENTGFSKANNQGIQIAKGEYVLLLNPDTLVEQDCFTKCLDFMNQHPAAGALGVKMIDGKGNYAPESKRGIPSPWVAFCKIFGLTRLFPRSPRFARYYLGHLPNDESGEIEIVSGAFMFIRQTALQKAGLLDESFFMYGEDIDLSVRIMQSGFKNYYLPATTIIHYKGESTKKGSLNYIKIFYKAMALFSQKHFSSRQTRIFNFAINLAIYLRAILSLVKRVVSSLFLPVIDALTIFLGFHLFASAWGKLRFETGQYPHEFQNFVIPIYIAIWIGSLVFTKTYAKPVSIKNLIRGILSGALLVMLLYSFLSESWRFSRALILIGTCWTLITLPAIRYLLSLTNFSAFKLKGLKPTRIVVVAGSGETERIEELLQNANYRYELLGTILPNDRMQATTYLGNFSQIREIIQIYQPEELIFSGKDVAPGAIIDCMLDLNDKKLNFKIAPQESFSIIGSNSPNSSGELLHIQANPLSKKINLFYKRLLDLKMAALLLLFFPIIFWTFSSPKGLVKNCFSIIAGRKTWIGFASPQNIDEHLPFLKPGILTPSSPFGEQFSQAKILDKDRLYAKNYRILTDLELIFRNWKNLGK